MFEELMDFTMTGHGVSVQFRVLRMGTDCLVLAAGGDTGHIGAIAFGDRDECLSNAREGHREGVVTELIYRELESVVSGGLAVLAGIHVDGITKEQITGVVALCEEGAHRIAAGLREYQQEQKEEKGGNQND